MTIKVTDEMIYAFAGEPEITATDAHAIRVGLTAVLPLAERTGYEKAIAVLQGVAQRTGSPAAKWAAEYLAVDPDKQGPRARPPGYEQQVRMVEHGRNVLNGYDCPDHPGPLDDARDHVCRLRPIAEHAEPRTAAGHPAHTPGDSQ